MKIVANKRRLVYTLIAFSATILFLGAFTVCLLRCPDAITYDVVSQSRAASAGDLIAEEYFDESLCLYNSINEIPNEGPFTVREENGEIFVFSEEGRLLRVNASLKSLPEADKKAILVGIRTETKKELFELIRYMES